MPAFPTGRLFAGRDLCPDYDVSLTTRAQPEKFDTTLPGGPGGVCPTNAQFYAYLATLPSWSAAAVTTGAEFIAAATAIDAAGAVPGVIQFSASYNGDDLTPPNRPLPDGVQPDFRTCTIYCVPETLPNGFPDAGQDQAASAVRAVRDQLPAIHSRNGVANGYMAINHLDGGMAQYGYRWIGIRLIPRTDGGTTDFPRVWSSHLSSGITLDRCHIDGVTDATRGDIQQPPGFQIDGRYTASLDSWYDNLMGADSERQCILAENGGPYKIVGNVLLGNGECFIAGGEDPVNPSVVDNYPRDLEFRRNFCRQQSGANPLHPAFYQLATVGGNARTILTGLTGAAYDGGTRTLTLSTGAFDVSLTSQADSFRRLRYWYVTSGAGVGSHGEVSTYNSATSVTSTDATLTLLTGAAIDSTSVIEIRESMRWISKNCFELKTMRRAYVEGCVLENAWNMDGQQRNIVNLKSVNQEGAGVLSLTTDITWVNSLLLNCWGGILVSAMPTPPCLAAGKMHFENVLEVAMPHLDFVGGDTSFSAALDLAGDALTFRRCTALNFQRSVLNVESSSNPDDAGAFHPLADLVLDGYLASDAAQDHITGAAAGVGFQSGVAAYDGNLDAATAVWRVGICGSTTVTSPSTQYPNSSDPGAAFVTSYTTDAEPFVNPLLDFTDPTCDYSLKPGDPLASLSAMSVDWLTLQAAVATVRPATTVVPYQWIGTETIAAPAAPPNALMPPGAALLLSL